LWILNVLVNANAINLRTLLKFCNSDYPVRTYEFRIGSRRKGNIQFGILLVFDFLVSLYGNSKNLLSALEKCRNYETGIFYDPSFNARADKYSVGALLVVLDIENHNFDCESAFTYTNK